MSGLGAGILLVIGAVVCATGGDLALKKSVGCDVSFVVGALLYAIAAVPVTLSYRTISFGGVALLWQMLMIGASLLLAVFMFGEQLSAAKVGALFAMLVACALVALDGG